MAADSERPGPGNPIRVFLLDDHEVVRRGVRDLLDDEPDISVVGEAGTVQQALVRVPALRPRVARRPVPARPERRHQTDGPTARSVSGCT